jgi:uridine nucleosidase
MPHKIIIDTDPGIDDAMAIFLALCSPELEVIGLTTIFGNHKTDLTTVNALRLLEIAGRPDIPVARGADHPLVGEFQVVSVPIHGDDGQGNTFLPPPQTQTLDISAAQFIIQQVMGHPGEITLVPIGPLTNLALALRLEPRLAEKVKGVVLMGGNAFERGNITPAAEANIYKDPEAAEMVFAAGWHVTMIGLDVTRQVVMLEDGIAQIREAGNGLARHLTQILPYYMNIYRTYGGHLTLHDPTAIVYLFQPELFHSEACAVRVELDGLGRGKTWAVPQSSPAMSFDGFTPWRDRPAVEVAVGVEADMVLKVMLERLT